MEVSKTRALWLAIITAQLVGLAFVWMPAIAPGVLVGVLIVLFVMLVVVTK